jgi:plastocyanin
MRRSFWLGIAVVAALGLACSSDNNNNPPPDSGTPDSGVPDSGTPDAGGNVVTITISGFAYSPASVNVAPGSTIRFVNNDSTAHTATTEAAADDFTPGGAGNVQFDSSTIAAGGNSGDIPIPANAVSGTTVHYYCNIHKGAMAQGELVIQE